MEPSPQRRALFGPSPSNSASAHSTSRESLQETEESAGGHGRTDSDRAELGEDSAGPSHGRSSAEVLRTSRDGERPQSATDAFGWALMPPANQRAVQEEEVHVMSPAPEADQMGDDGFPLVTDMEANERAREVERQQAIDRVIDQQAFNQDVIESLAQLNHRRIFGGDEEGEEVVEMEPEQDACGSQERPERPRNLRVRSPPPALLNEDGTLTTHGQELVNSYHRQRNAAENRVPVPPLYYGDEEISPEENEPNVCASTSRRLLPSPFPANTSHVLAIGRKPSQSSHLSTVSRPANAEESHPLGWQATKNSLKERISFMYCNEILADVYFIVGKEDSRERIPAHKFVLSIGSVVFDAMFNGGLTPHGHSASEPLEIELPDVEPAAFLSLLRFLYSDDVSIGPDSVMTTLYTAKKYAVPAMETACVEFLKQSLGADNAFMLLTQARLFDEPQLAELCLEKIDKNTTEALNAESFNEIDHDTLCLVLARDSLRVREVQLFQAVVGWASEECGRRGLGPTAENRRAVLGRALSLIRFPIMTIEEFASTAAQTGLLPDHELVALFLHFTVNPKPPTAFIERPRSVMAGKELVVNRFQRVEGRWGYSGTPDRIKFTVDRKIFVVGFGLHGSIHGPHEYQVTIQIIHCGTGRVLAHNDTSFLCDGSANTFRVSFKEPVEVTPSVTYIASACLKGPDSHYGTKGLRRIVHQSSTGSPVAFQFTYAAGNNNGTSVEDGQIPEIYFYRSPLK